MGRTEDSTGVSGGGHGKVIEVRDKLLGYVNRELLADRALHAELDTELFEEGWIESLSILKLIAYLELIIDREILDEEIVLKNFRTVNTIAAYFGARKP
jgi:acyl carrier protein